MSAHNSDWPNVVLILGVIAIAGAIIIWGPEEVVGLVVFALVVLLVGLLV